MQGIQTVHEEDEKKRLSKWPLAAIITALATLAAVAALVGLYAPSVPDKPFSADDVDAGSVVELNGTEYGGKALSWRVLEKEGSKVLLITEEIVDFYEYNEMSEKQIKMFADMDEDIAFLGFFGDTPFSREFAVTWEECSIRAWLNDVFISSFDSSVVEKICETCVKNDDNPEYGTDGGRDTVDKVFLLSIEEAQRYFESDTARIAKWYPSQDQLKDAGERFAMQAAQQGNFTVYASEFGEVFTNYLHETDNAFRWGLRSPGRYAYDAAFVDTEGDISSIPYIDLQMTGVRPAIWLETGAGQ